MTTGPANYDEIVYPNYVFSDTHPSRLAAIGKFFGLSCPASDSAKILEIGCAGGLNALSHATSLPNASFLAIDSSAQQIKAATELQKLSGISNVKFDCTKLESLHSASGKFDYIICHGVFSWVSKHLQHEILKLCRNFLSETGIAFISYNTLPGWHIQNILRDSLLYRSQDISDRGELVKQSKDFLRFAKDLFPKSAKPILNPAIEHLLDVPDNYLVHEHLGEINNPMYFHEFTELCQQHGLIYLAESELGTMIPKEFEPGIQDKIVELSGGSLSRMEQYCDFLRLRQFRKTLICRDSCGPQRRIDLQRLLPLSITASKTHKPGEYKTKGELKNTKFEFLDQQFPRCLSVQECADKAKDPEFLPKLLELIMLDSIEIRDINCPIKESSTEVSNLSPLVKALIPQGNIVPNLRSDTVAISQSICDKLKNNTPLNEKDFKELCALGLMR